MNKTTMYDHTPGMWEVVHGEVIRINAHDGTVAIATNLNRLSRRNIVEVESNALLIAAAPDLLRERDELRSKVNKAMAIIKHGCDWQVPDDVLKNISDALK